MFDYLEAGTKIGVMIIHITSTTKPAWGTLDTVSGSGIVIQQVNAASVAFEKFSMCTKDCMGEN